MSEMVTKNELDIHLKGIDDRMGFNEHVTDIRISAIKDAIDSHLAETRALIEKNAAEYREIASGIKSEVEQLRIEFNGKINVLDAKIDAIQIKFGWAITGLGIGITVLLFLLQKFF